MNDYATYKMMENGFSPYEQVKIGYMQNKDHNEIMASLNELKRKAESNHHSFVSDFGANIAGNAAWDGLL